MAARPKGPWDDRSDSLSDDRESLGILAIDKMPDFSGSLLPMDSPDALFGKQMPSSQQRSVTFDLKEPGDCSDFTRNIDRDDPFNDLRSKDFGSKLSDEPYTEGLDEVPMELVDSQYNNASNAEYQSDAKLGRTPDSKPDAEPEMGMLLGAFAGIRDDADASFQEICFDAEELNDFDEEFSDLGDSDHDSTHTLTDGEGKDASPNDYLEGLDDIEMPDMRDSCRFESLGVGMSGRPSFGLMDSMQDSRPDQMFDRSDDASREFKDDFDMTGDIINSVKFGEGQEVPELGSGSSTSLASKSGSTEKLDPVYFQHDSFGQEGTHPCGDGEEDQSPLYHASAQSIKFASSNIFGDTLGSNSIQNPDRGSDIFGNLIPPMDDDPFGPDAPPKAVAKIPGTKPGHVVDFENSPVFINEDGEGVTDLAYRVPLDHPENNPFDTEVITGGLCEGTDDEFFSADHMIEQFKKDEEKFAKENMFRQDEVMPNLSVAEMQDSWSFHNLLTKSQLAQDIDTSAPYMRISVGAFWGMRTETLGSLDGDKDKPRPAFGTKILTPPDNRVPLSLIGDHSSPNDTTMSMQEPVPAGDDIRQAGVGSDIDGDGFELGDGTEDAGTPTPMTADRTMTAADLTGPSPVVNLAKKIQDNSMFGDSQCKQPSRSQRDLCQSPAGKSDDENNMVSAGTTKLPPEGAAVDLIPQGALNNVSGVITPTFGKTKSRSNLSDLDDVMDRTSVNDDSADSSKLLYKFDSRSASPCVGDQSSLVVNMSALTNLISSDANIESDELANIILKLSQERAAAKRNSRDQRKATVEAQRDSTDSSDADASISDAKRMPPPDRVPNRPSQAHDPVRRPADGKPAKQRDQRTSYPRKDATKPINKADSVPVKNPERRVTEGRMSGERRGSAGSSGIPTLSRRGSGSSFPSSERRDSAESITSKRISREPARASERKGSGNVRTPSPSQLISKEIVPASKVQEKLPNCDSESVTKTEESRSRVLNTSKDQDVRAKLPIEKLSLKSRPQSRKDEAASATQDKFKTEMQADPKSSHNAKEPKWKSPRPSSVMFRSSHMHGSDTESEKSGSSTYGVNKHKDNDQAKPPILLVHELEHTPVKRGTTMPRRVQFEQAAEPPSDDKPAPVVSQTIPVISLDQLTPEMGNSTRKSVTNKKWLSSTPKEMRDAYLLSTSQETLSDIAPSPRDSFLTNYSDVTMTATQDNNTTITPPDAQLYYNSSAPSRSSYDRSKTDNLPDGNQNPNGSYQPVQSFQQRLLASTANAPSQSMTALLNSQHLTSSQFTSNYLNPNLPPATSQSVFFPSGDRLSTAPVTHSYNFSRADSFTTQQQLQSSNPPSFENRPSLPFDSGSMAPQDNDSTLRHSSTGDTQGFVPRLSDIRESIPGVPSSQSTPLGQSLSGPFTALSPRMSVGDGRDSYLVGYSSDGLKTSWRVPDSFNETCFVDVPPKVKIPGVCCVGLSIKGMIPLHNHSDRWLHVQLQMFALSVDGEDQNIHGASPFFLRDKIIMEPNKSEDTKVVFAPRHPGVYFAQFYVLASPFVADQPMMPSSRSPPIITIQAMAEKPMIQIVSERTNMVDFGALPWGCQKGLPITLVNKGRADVPVRLLISSGRSTHNCFTFEKYSNPDVSIISNASRPPIPSLAPTIANYVLPGSQDTADMKPVQAIIYFKAPPRQFERGSGLSVPEEFHAILDIEMDTPSKLMTLGCVDLVANVGIARLHAPTDLDEVVLKTYIGKPVTQTIPLRNAGNIPLDVSVEVTHWPDFFSVIPMQVMIEPGGQSDVTIKFEPKPTTVTKFDSLLLMFVEPDGPGYEIQLMGEVCPIPRAVPRGPQLLTNKHSLSWGGVALGDSKQQRFALKNAADHMMKFILIIRGNTTDFKLQTSFSHKANLTSSKEIILRPLEEYPVHVVFSPTRVSGLDAKLQIKQINMPLKYTIPLTGYGGVSELSLEGVSCSNQNVAWMNLGHPEPGENLVTKVRLHNHGCRPAFIKAINFYDLGCKRKLPPGRVIVEPNQFCLREKGTQEVTITADPTEKESALCHSKAAIMASVAFFYGDELSRQLYRIGLRKTNKPSSVHLADDNPLKGVHFDTGFQGDDGIADGHDVKQTSNDMELFYSGIRRLILALVGSPPSPQTAVSSPGLQKPAQAKPLLNDLNKPKEDSLDTKGSWVTTGQGGIHKATDYSMVVTPPLAGKNPLRTSLESPPVHDTDVPTYSNPSATHRERSLHRQCLSAKPEFSPSAQNKETSADQHASTTSPETRMEWWTLKPEQLIISAPLRDGKPVIRKLQITNYTDRTMNYELSWPGRYVVVTPDEGNVPPRSFETINVSACPQLLQKTVQLPWSGKIHVTCDGESKAVKIQIRNEDSGEMSPVVTKTVSKQDWPVKHSTTPLVAVATPSKASPGEHLKVTQQMVEFPATDTRVPSEQLLEIRNLRPSTVRWNISSFAPAFFKRPDGSSDLCRVSHSVFWLPQMTGLLEAHQSAEVQIHFSPHDPGLYVQCWELRSEVVATGDELGTSHTCKLELTGQAVRPVTECAHATNINVLKEVSNIDKTRSANQNDDEAIVIRQETIKFKVSSPGNSDIQKTQVRNKTQQVLQVAVLPAKEPFYTKHSKFTIKPQHYVRLPVEFKPRHSGYFQGVLMLKTPAGKILTQQLEATCD